MAKNGQKIKKVQKEGKCPKGTNYNFTINNKKLMLPVQNIFADRSCFSNSISTLFQLENLTSGYAFIGEFTLNN